MTKLQGKGKLESAGIVARYKYRRSRRGPAHPGRHYTIVDQLDQLTPHGGSVVHVAQAGPGSISTAAGR